MTWQNGRQLASFTQTNGASVNYTYDVDGLRTGKTVTSGTTTDTVKYVYENGLLLQMRYNHMYLDFSYDANGAPVSLAYRSTATSNPVYYYYALNSRGDVIGLYNNTGTLTAKYSYDAYGNLLGVTNASGSAITAKYAPANLNPLRYRGYVYDTETGLYYLQSRYYDPETCRFINADNQLSSDDITGINLFAYCGNNPVNRIDPTGEAWWHWAIGAAVVVACAAATVVTCGGFAAAAGAVSAVACGVAAASTASTVAAGAFIGSAVAFGTAVAVASANSSSIQEFNDQGDWGTVAYVAGGAITGGCEGYAMSKPKTSTSTTTNNLQSNGRHTSGVGSPKKNVNPSGSYTKLDNNGNLYSYTQFDSLGRQTMRIDFQGRPHAGVLPHIHLYTYPQQGGRVEYIFDLNWNLIN